jgi:RND family efflux transporter MFP subunit
MDSRRFPDPCILLIALLTVGVIGCTDVYQDAALDGSEEERVLPVRTVSVTMQSSYEVEDRFLGELETARTSLLGFELAGTVVQVAVDEGDSVQAGQTLAFLDTARLEAGRRQQEALLLEAKASFTLAETTHKRVAKLAATGAVSSQDLDEATQGRDAAQASVDRVQAALQSIDIDVAKSLLIAPYSGRIAKRQVDEGTIVKPGQVTLELIESQILEARIGVTAKLASTLTTGQEVTLHHAAIKAGIAAQVRQVAPRKERRTRTVDVLLKILKPEGLVPGDLVEWPVATTVQAEGTWLPRNSLTSSKRGLWAVYIAIPSEGTQHHQLERREVEVIHMASDLVFVQGAIRDGQIVVTDGIQRLVPAQRVSVSHDY